MASPCDAWCVHMQPLDRSEGPRLPPITSCFFFFFVLLISPVFRLSCSRFGTGFVSLSAFSCCCPGACELQTERQTGNLLQALADASSAALGLLGMTLTVPC